MKYILVALFSGSLFAQDVPMGDAFFIKGGISSRKWFMEQNDKRLAEFPEKYAKVAEEKIEYEKALEAYIKKITEIKSKTKHTKQEKAFLAVSKCLRPVMEGTPGKGGWGVANSKFTCAYSTNIDERLLRQTPKGKPLGEDKEIMEQGDEISKFYLFVTKNIPSEEEFKKFKEYEGALASQKSMKEDNEKKGKEIADLEKLLAKRIELDNRVENELMKCKTPLSLPLEKHDTKLSGNGSSELIRDFFESAVKDVKIPDESYAKHQDKWVMRTWQELMNNGFCPEKIKETDCVNCQKQMEEKLTQMEDFLKSKNEFKECSDKKWNGMAYKDIRVDLGPTSLSVQNKDRKKGIEHMRKVVMTNLAQGLPVGAMRMDKFESIIAVRPEKNECHYQVKNYANGETFWIEEESFFEYLKEISQLNRNFL